MADVKWKHDDRRGGERRGAGKERSGTEGKGGEKIHTDYYNIIKH